MKRVIPVLLMVMVPAVVLAAGGEHGAHAEGHHAFPTTYVVSLVLNFLAFVGILYAVVYKKADAFFTQRHEEIKAKLERLQRAEAEANEKIREYGDKLKELSTEGEKIMEQYRVEAAEERTKIIARAEETAARIKNDAERTLNNELSRVKAELRQEAAAEIIKQAESILKDRINDEDRQRLVRQSLDDLKEVANV